MCMSVCVKSDVGEKGRGKRRGVQMLEFDGQSSLTGSVAIISSPSSIPPLDHHPPLPSPSSRLRIVVGVIFRERSRDTVLSNSDQKRKKRAPAHRSSLNSPDSGKPFEFSRQWRRRRTAFFFFWGGGGGGVVGNFPKKAENDF